MSKSQYLRHDKYLTVDEAAVFLGVRPTTIRAHFTTGRLARVKFKHMVLVDRDELERYKLHRREVRNKFAPKNRQNIE